MSADDYADLARHAEAAQRLTPGEWVAGDGWVYTLPVYDDDNRLASVLGMKCADRDRANAEHARAQRNAEFIAAANPATILRLIAEVRRLTDIENGWRHDRSEWEAERDALAARLAAVEALADEWERTEAYACLNAGDCTRCVTYQGAVIHLRAVLSATPTDTTKETDR